MINTKKIIIRTANNGKDYLGIKMGTEAHEATEIIIPKYYMPEMEKPIEDLTKEEKQKLKKMVRAWKKYQSRIKTKNNGELQGDGINFDFDTVFRLVQDFLEYGLYIEFEKTEIRSNYGKIDFPRTIKKCKL